MKSIAQRGKGEGIAERKRMLAGLDLVDAIAHHIEFRGAGVYRVPSTSTPETSYEVHTAEGHESCTCPDYQYRGKPCKHVYAAVYTEIRRRYGRVWIEWDSDIRTATGNRLGGGYVVCERLRTGGIVCHLPNRDLRTSFGRERRRMGDYIAPARSVAGAVAIIGELERGRA